MTDQMTVTTTTRIRHRRKPHSVRHILRDALGYVSGPIGKACSTAWKRWNLNRTHSQHAEKHDGTVVCACVSCGACTCPACAIFKYVTTDTAPAVST